MIFLVPLAVSISAVVYFWLASDLDLFWKGLATALVAASLALQFTTVGAEVHFLVPTLTEVFVGLWGAFVVRLDLA
ncbi:MAG: hypothetical protein R3F62_29010 [Planctomycetota bacterium]